MTLQAETVNFVRQLPLFKGLSEPYLNDFFKNSVTAQYRKNQHLYHRHDKAMKLFIILDGWVSLYRETVDGEQIISGLLKRGDVFDERALISDNENYLFSAKTIEKSKILEIPHSFFQKNCEGSNAFMARLVNSMMDKAIRQQVENEHLTVMNSSQRLACLLLRLSSHMIGKGGVLILPYDKSVAAAQLGMKRETFSRALNQLKPWGVTIKGSEFRIENFARLSTFCCQNCSLGPAECPGNRCATCPMSIACQKAKEQQNTTPHPVVITAGASSGRSGIPAGK